MESDKNKGDGELNLGKGKDTWRSIIIAIYRSFKDYYFRDI